MCRNFSPGDSGAHQFGPDAPPLLHTYPHLLQLYVRTINENGGHEIDREQGKIHRSVLEEENEGRNDVIVIYSQKGKINNFKKHLLKMKYDISNFSIY